MDQLSSRVTSSTSWLADEDTMEAPRAFLRTQQRFTHNQHTHVDHRSYVSPIQNSGYCPPTDYEHQTHFSHRRNQSASSHSSYSSAYRSSDGSVFSQWPSRSSMASTNTTWSDFSAYENSQQNPQTEHGLDSQFITSPPPTTCNDATPLSVSAKRTALRQQATKKDPFATCMSKLKRTRAPQKLHRYWCTICKEGFGEKYDWKRHEETYQERTQIFECDLCDNIYFLDKDFVHHHQKSHRCRVCGPKQHVDSARKKRVARTGWGCGFCTHFSANWMERCHHISEHFEKDRKTMDDWKHAQVIFSLLQRPEINPHWQRKLAANKLLYGGLSWNWHNTGRVEGYPESNPVPQLQDMLEYYNHGQNIATIVETAYQKAHNVRAEKELPPLPVQEEEYEPMIPRSTQHHSNEPSYFSPHCLNNNIPSWNDDSLGIMSMILEDNIQPTDVCTLDYDALNAAFNDVLPDFDFST